MLQPNLFRLEPAAAADASASMVMEHLQRSLVFREYQKAFETTIGLPLALRAAGSFQFPLHGSKHANRFCTLMAGTNQTCSGCLQLQQTVEEQAVFGAKTMKCFTGLNESAVPIRVGDKVLGYLQTGQVFLQAPTPAHFRSLSRRLAGRGFPIDHPQLKSAYFRTRVMTRMQYDSVVKLLGIFAQHLAVLCNQVMLTEAASEDPLITRARVYIAEHQSEAVTLRNVAQEVNRSACYFCKTFKDSTGLTFTDYLARMRIETVKLTLLNPNKRVSEAAFAAGFQSLSQFNRTFRRIEGRTPMAWRNPAGAISAA